MPDDLQYAYEHVFTSSYGTMVLRDLMIESGFLAAQPKGTAPDVLIDHNAQRRLFGRVYEILAQSTVGREAIAWAMSQAQPEKETS